MIKKVKPYIKVIPVMLCVLTFIFIAFNATCKNPEDLNPDEDTLLNSPLAPRLLAPADSYAFMTDGGNINFKLDWEAVDSAVAYEMELTIAGHPSTVVLDSNAYAGLIDQAHFGENSWRVRASSTRWKGGYSAWSDTLTFFTSHPPFPPDQVLPPYDAQIVSDSVTAYVGFEWGSVARAKFYELEIYYDSMLIYSISLSQFTDSIYLDDTGHYDWRVRAGSAHWQMPGQWSDLWPFTITNP